MVHLRARVTMHEQVDGTNPDHRRVEVESAAVADQ
jgi:hypothetical protein